MEGQQDEYKLEDGKFQLDTERNFLLWGGWTNTGIRGERGCDISMREDSMQPEPGSQLDWRAPEAPSSICYSVI